MIFFIKIHDLEDLFIQIHYLGGFFIKKYFLIFVSPGGQSARENQAFKESRKLEDYFLKA